MLAAMISISFDWGIECNDLVRGVMESAIHCKDICLCTSTVFESVRAGIWDE